MYETFVELAEERWTMSKLKNDAKSLETFFLARYATDVTSEHFNSTCRNKAQRKNMFQANTSSTDTK